MPCFRTNHTRTVKRINEYGKLVKTKVESHGFLCGKRLKETDFQYCALCGAIADYACDFPVGQGKTCDKLLCKSDARIIGGDIDYCPEHARIWERFKAGKLEQELQKVVPFSKIARLDDR